MIIESSTAASPRGTFSPIRELGPSLAASVAGGTVIAARSPRRPSLRDGESNVDDNEEEDCVVVLVRSPIGGKSETPTDPTQQKVGNHANLTVTSVFGGDGSESDGTQRRDDEARVVESNPTSEVNRYYNGLSFLPNGPVNFPYLSSGSSNLHILHSPSGLLVAATGFLPDAEHILNVAAGRVFSRLSVYDAQNGGRGVDPHRLVREDLSSVMMDAAMTDGGRPLGAQLLVVGQSVLHAQSPLDIYTVDPSGGWRSWVGIGASVGRGAERVNSSLLHSQSSMLRADESLEVPSNMQTSGWKGALDRAIISAVDALDVSTDETKEIMIDTQRNGAKTKYGAVVIFGNKRRIHTQSRCAVINPAIVEERFSMCCDYLINKRKLNTSK